MSIIRKAIPDDIETIADIYDIARKFMREHGNSTQWNNNYPPIELITDDIKRKQLYVIEEHSRICAVFMFNICEDPTYAVIESGSWLSDAPYGVIHRVASNLSLHGVMDMVCSYCFIHIPHLRIDTHKDNYVMQGALEKNGFSRRGIIYLSSGAQRIAYERIYS